MTGINRELSEIISEAMAEIHARRLAYMGEVARKREEELAHKRWITEFLDEAEKVFTRAGIKHICNEPQDKTYSELRETWYDTLLYPVPNNAELAIKLQGERNQRVHSRPMIGKARILALAGEDEFTLFLVDSYTSEIRNWLMEPANEQQKEMARSIVGTLHFGLEVPQTRRILFFSSH